MYSQIKLSSKNLSLEKITHMKTLSTLFLAIVFPGWLIGQVSIDTITYAYPGDTIVRYVDLAPEGVEITDAGGDQEWHWTLSNSLTRIAVFDTNDRMDEFPFATIKMTEGIVENYFFINDINWALQGFVAEDPVGMGLVVSSFYTPAFSQEYAPIAFEDTIVQVFAVYTGIPLSVIPDTILDGLPVQPDSLRVKVSTIVIDDADAWGALGINETSMLVLRQRRESRIAIAIEAKVSILPWVDVTSLILDFIDSLPGGISLTDTTVLYRFLAPGFALPLAEVTVDNDTVRSVVFQGDILSALKDIVFAPSEINIFPNPASGEINLSLLDSDRRVDRIIVSDLNGRLVQSDRVFSDQDIIQIRLDGVPGGLYFLTLFDEEGKMLGTGKVSLIDN
jgi:Secretion system C-terminal sorting domain